MTSLNPRSLYIEQTWIFYIYDRRGFPSSNIWVRFHICNEKHEIFNMKRTIWSDTNFWIELAFVYKNDEKLKPTLCSFYIKNFWLRSRGNFLRNIFSQNIFSSVAIFVIHFLKIRTKKDKKMRIEVINVVYVWSISWDKYIVLPKLIFRFDEYQQGKYAWINRWHSWN